MNGCVESGSFLVYHRLDEAVEAFVPAVEALVQRVAPDDIVTSESETGGYRFSAPIWFADGIGQGDVVARLFRYRESVRIDVEVVHNRVFAKLGGGPSDRRCYLNDFIASISLSAEADALPEEFVQRVRRGVARARTGVQRHNSNQASPWNKVTVAVAEP